MPFPRGTCLAFSPPAKTLWSTSTEHQLTPFPSGDLEGNSLIRIVLIEDDHLMREWLGRSLSSRGHSVRRFARGDEALAAVLADMPDVVVSDIGLPGMSGIEVGRRLRARGIDVPIVFMTADRDTRIDDDARALGSRWMLHKPFNDIADLWCAVDEARESRSSDADSTEASHALRTPLTAVRMALEGLVGDRERSSAERHLTDIARRNLDRLEAAVESHLTPLTPRTETVDERPTVSARPRCVLRPPLPLQSASLLGRMYL